jgi:hypothetical protein
MLNLSYHSFPNHQIKSYDSLLKKLTDTSILDVNDQEIMIQCEEKYKEGFYQGELRKNSDGTRRISYRGRMTYDNGIIYQGSFIEEKITGMGLALFKSKIYQGEFQNNKANGHGEFIYQNNRRYLGLVKEGNREGQGEIIDHDGTRFIGQFKDNIA